MSLSLYLLSSILIRECICVAATAFWNTTIPDLAVNETAGIQLINSKHFTIFNATSDDGKSANTMGTFNHGPQLILYNNIFHASWYNSLQNGNDLFMRVLYSTSTNGANWSKAKVLFPNTTTNGSYAEPFLILNNKLYASCSLWTNNKQGVVAQMRLINTDTNNFGEIFWLSSTVPNGFEKFGYKTYIQMPTEIKNDMETYFASLIVENIPISPVNNPNVIFNQTKSMYLIPNDNVYSNDLQLMLLIRDGSGITNKLWSSVCTIENSANKNLININETLLNRRACRAGDYYFVNLV
eukprot:350002_1